MRKWLLFLVTIILIALAIAWYVIVNQKTQPDIQLARVHTTSTNVTSVLAVNLSTQILSSQIAVEQGTMALFVIYNSKTNNALYLNFITSVKELFSLDRDYNGMIDQLDPAYAEMAILTLAGPQRITPLNQAGIRQIQFDPTAFQKVKTGQPLLPGDIVAHAIMIDSNVYPMKMITIDKTRLNKVLNP